MNIFAFCKFAWCFFEINRKNVSLWSRQQQETFQKTGQLGKKFKQIYKEAKKYDLWSLKMFWADL